MAEGIGRTPFSELVKEAPEAKNPYVAHLITGEVEQWPFKLVEEPDSSKAVFVANSGAGYEGSPHKIAVSYEEPLGISAKRTLFYRQPEFSRKYFVEGGEVRIRSGGLDIVYFTALDSVFVTENILNDPKNFSPIISVEGSSGASIPPLANAKFDPYDKTPIVVDFPLADFDAATKGEIEQRRNKFDSRPSYRTNYFSLDKEGRRAVGVSRFEESTNTFAGKEHSHFDLRFSGWYQDDNAFRELEGSDYAAKVSSLNGQLRLVRQNMQTGEIWMLSVPEGIQSEVFYGDVVNLPMADFFQKYPVNFAFKKKGEKPTWTRSSVEA